MKIKNLILSVILILIALCSNLFAQNDIQIGKGLNLNTRYNGGLYDYSSPDAINIKVMIWGYVKYPGQYIIPANSGVNDLLSLAGGPEPDAHVNNLKLFRINKDSSQSIIKFNYSDLYNNSLSDQMKIPKLHAGDILLVPGSPKWYLKDYLGLALSILSAVVSITTLLVYIYK